MDDSMNSVHSVSAMDISPACSPRTALNPISSNHAIMYTFQAQQKLLSDALYNAPNRNDYSSINKNPIADENDPNSDSVCLFTTVLTENSSKPATVDETNHVRHRVTTVDPNLSVIDSKPVTKKNDSHPSKQPLSKVLLSIPLLVLATYLTVQYLNKPLAPLRSSSWQNASDYLTENLIGQDLALVDFKDSMEKHKNFSIVLIEGPTGTGKSFLASSLEKFIPTTLISANTLLGLPAQHWTQVDRLTSYLSSFLSSSPFQFLIIDDLDLLPNKEAYCQTFTAALHSIHDNKNLFVLLLKTSASGSICHESWNHTVTKSIQFNMLQREHVRKCIHNEAHTQNVQPPLDNEQIEKVLDSLTYTNEHGLAYSTTGCKEIPSLVMLASKKDSY